MSAAPSSGCHSLPSLTRSEHVRVCSHSAPCLVTVIERSSGTRSPALLKKQTPRHRVAPVSHATTRDHNDDRECRRYTRVGASRKGGRSLRLLARTWFAPRTGSAGQSDAEGQSWPVTCRLSRRVRCLRALVMTVSPFGSEDLRVPESSGRTVSRQGAESEATRTYLRRVRRDKLWHSESTMLRRSGSAPSFTWHGDEPQAFFWKCVSLRVCLGGAWRD